MHVIHRREATQTIESESEIGSFDGDLEGDGDREALVRENLNKAGCIGLHVGWRGQD